MTDGKVKFTYFGDGKDLEKELVRLEKKHDDLTNKIGQVSRRSRQSSKTGVQGLVDQVKGAANLSAALDGVKQVVMAITAEQRKLSQSIDETIPKLDEQQLKLQIQAGLTPRQVEGKIPQIRDALLNTPTTDLSGGFQLQTQLISSGFKKADVDSGEALQTILDLKAATANFGREITNVKETVSSVSQFLKATGQEATAENIRKTGGGVVQLFEGSEIQLKDLTALAANASGLTARGIDPQMQLAAFSVVRDQMNAEKGATAMSQIANEFGSAALDNRKVETLKSIGLTPQDIDLIGEDLPTAFERLKKATQGMNPEEINNIMTALVGKDAFKAAAALTANVEKIQERLKSMSGTAFERNVKIFQESRTAERQRVQIRREFAERTINEQRGGVTFKDARDRLQAEYAENMAQQQNIVDRFGTSLNTITDKSGMAVGEGLLGQSPQESFRTTQYAKEYYSFVLQAPQKLGEYLVRAIKGDQVFDYVGRELDVPQPGRGGQPAGDGAAAAGGMRVAVDNTNLERKLDEQRAEQRAAADETNRLLKEQTELMKQPGAAPRRPVNRNAQGE